SYLLALGSTVFVLISVAYWLWPRKGDLELMARSDLPERTGLPVMPTGSASSGWWGMVGALAVIGTVFGVLFYSYFELRMDSNDWPQGGLPMPELEMPTAGIALLPLSAGPLVIARRLLSCQRALPSVGFFLVATLLGGMCLVGLLWLSAEAGFDPQAN